MMRTTLSETAPPQPVARTSHGGFTATGICKRYVVEPVLTDVSITVRPGEVVALLGENGAGKSTLSSIIAGMVEPTSGTMSWRDQPYAPTRPADAIRAGIALIHQETRLLPDLSIAENVFVGHTPLRAGGFLDRGTMNKRAAAQLRRLGLDVLPTTPVRRLKVAAQQQVEIAKALTLESELLILDEPTAALGSAETERLFEQIELLRRDGVSFIYISHRLDEIATIANRVVVLRDGRVVAQHASAQIPTTTLVEQMVGRSVDRLFPRIPEPEGAPVLSVDTLSSPDGMFQDISFDVRSGEIFGIAGIVGAGRTELVRAIAGLDTISNGQVRLGGAVLKLREPGDAIRAGLVLVPEDRKREGVILDQSIGDNLAQPNLDRIARGGWINARCIQTFARTAIDRLGIKGQPRQLAGRLSGGNQQKVVIAKWLARDPRVVILDEPTRGIDVGARAAIYEVIADLARSGMAVVIVSSDLEEVLGLAHRLLVLSRGRNRGILDRSAADSVSVMKLATT